MHLWWSLCTLYLLACQVRVTVGDSGLCCCTCYVFRALINSLVCWREEDVRDTHQVTECVLVNKLPTETESCIQDVQAGFVSVEGIKPNPARELFLRCAHVFTSVAGGFWRHRTLSTEQSLISALDIWLWDSACSASHWLDFVTELR